MVPGVDLEGILHNGDDGRYRGDGKDDAHQQQDNVMGLGKKGFDLIGAGTAAGVGLLKAAGSYLMV